MNFRRSSSSKVPINVVLCCVPCIGLGIKQTAPPHRWVERTMSTMQGRIDIVEKVPDMAHHHATDFILRDYTMHDKAECHQHPGKIRGRENQEP